MGQGYSLTTLSAGSAGIDVPELSDISYERSMGTARFMKSIRARHQDGLVFVKVVMKPYPSMKLDRYVQAILEERRALEAIPNALSYQRIFETSSNGYLVRQYLYNSLYDRLSTRPFLEDVEKKWLAFQLLCAVRDCHSREVYHGDIKTENILVTSWHWLYLSDFSSSFKPTFLPEDNPADFSYYFDTSGRRTCYLAPERFLLPGEQAEGKGKINWAMDVFSAGCVIAELFLETPIFTLSQLFKYRKGEYDPEHAHLSRIEDKDIRELVTHMIQIDPESRYSAEEYLNFWRRKAFPEYFYSFLHQYMGLVTDPSSGQAPVTAESANFGEADDRIDRIYYDFDKISYFLGYENEKLPVVNGTNKASETDAFPVYLDIPNNRHRASAISKRTNDDGTLLFLSLVLSSLRNTARASARVRACDLLLAFAERTTDETKLDRILPHLLALLNDPADLVKITAIRSLTQLTALVFFVSPVNAYVFPEYILPRLQPLIFGSESRPRPSAIVRATYASCLATLAQTASRYLDMVQALRLDGALPILDPETEDGVSSDPAYRNLFDSARPNLVEWFEAHTKALLTDDDPSVRRAFLGSVSSLCVFFGSSKANDVILSHLNTYLNDKDWMLKCAFFETIVGVATFVGSVSLEEFILPLMVQALTDPEEFVVEKVLRSFASMANLGLFQRSSTWELVAIVARFTMHPNIWVREAAAHFLAAATTYLSVADVHCIILPLIAPYLKTLVTDCSEIRLLDALRRPISRPAFDMLLLWATKVEKGLFWNPALEQKTFNFSSPMETLASVTSRDSGYHPLSRTAKNEEDDQWLVRLRNMGMVSEDEGKIVALREYLWRIASSRSKDTTTSTNLQLNAVISLQQLGVTPRTVFFNSETQPSSHLAPFDETAIASPQGPHTIADALLDASMTIDDPTARNRLSHTNSRSDRSNRTYHVQNTSHTKETRRKSGVLSPDHGNGSEASTSSDMPIHNHVVKHKASAIKLMDRNDSAKSFAETATSSANAIGKVDTRYSLGRADTAQPIFDEKWETDNNSPRFRAAHTYEGNDPNVLKLLDSLYLENYPSDIAEFGPIVTPIARRQPIRRSNGQAAERSWRPDGNLVAVFGEHTAAINRVAVSPDHAFFITCSDDGTVKVWDAARLERNVTHRSRQTYKQNEGTKVKCLCFVENTHCFVTGATDGSIHVVKVDYSNGSGAAKYGKLRMLKQYQLPTGEHAVWVEHYRAEIASVLMIATNTSNIVALDLRTMTILFSLKNPVHHGTPTCFVVDKKRNWLLLGTSHGVLDLWDLRFRVRLKAWGISGGTPIHRLSIHPTKGRGKWVCVAGGSGQGEIMAWDIEKTQCREVYRTSGSKDDWKGYEPWLVDDERPEGMLGRFATALEQSGSGTVDRGIRALAVGMDTSEDGRDSRTGFILTGGSDRKVRFWDVSHIETSMVVSGLAVEEGKPTFSSAQPTPSLVLNTEKIPHTGPTSNTGNKISPSPASKKTNGRSTKSTVVSLQQQQLLKSHLDSILDVALLEVPYGMTISVDRSGVIYVFQ